jgi:hypothetical protein
MQPPRANPPEPSKPAKDHIEYGERRWLSHADAKDRKIIKRMNRDPLLTRILNWVLSAKGR